MEASAFPAPSGLARTRLSIGAPLLRLRSDEQLVASFRDGNNEAFRVIYDRYRQRLFAYTRQMLPGSRQDAEDALQDVFVRAFGGLRANDRDLALRAWLYRVAHNRCIDELRRPALPAPELMELVRPPLTDPIAEAEQRESLRRLIADVRRLPEQQRSALLMRELAGMSYVEISVALAVSVPAIKSLLVRARVGLAQAAEARETSCSDIREDLIVAHDRGVRPNGMARRHIRDCAGCREFRAHLRGTSRQFASLLPGLGPAGLLAKLLGFGGGGGGAAAGGGAVAATAGTGGTVASVGVFATGAGHVATILAAAVVTAGGAVEIQHTIQHTIAPVPRHSHHRSLPVAKTAPAAASPTYRTYSYSPPAPTEPVKVVAAREIAQPSAPAAAPSHPTATARAGAKAPTTSSLGGFADMNPASTGGPAHKKSSENGTTTDPSTATTSPGETGTTPPGTGTGSSSTSTGSTTGGSGGTGSSATGASGSGNSVGSPTSSDDPSNSPGGSQSGLGAGSGQGSDSGGSTGSIGPITS